MTDDANLDRALERVRAARADYEARQDDVAQARERYYEAVRSLNSSGMSLREVADALGLSHQRVHQMIHEAEPRGSKVSRGIRKASKAGGVVVLVALLVSSVVWFATQGGEPAATRSPSRVASLGTTPSTSPDGVLDQKHRLTRRKCFSIFSTQHMGTASSGSNLRAEIVAVRDGVNRVWFDGDGGRTVRDVIVDMRVSRRNRGVDVIYTVEPHASLDC